MKNKILFFLVIIAAIISNGYAQNPEPLALAKLIFGDKHFPDIDKYVTGEYDGKPDGADVASGVIKKFLLLEQTESKAVVVLTLLDSTGQGMDAYLHFSKDTCWKMNAMRGLALTGIIEEVKNMLEKLTPKEVDEMIKENKEKANGSFASREEYEFELGNARLTLELDDKIIEHFQKNKTAFERIRELILTEDRHQC